MSINKHIEHFPRTAAEAVTTPVKIHKDRHEKGVEYYSEITYIQDGEAIKNGKIAREKISITRATCNLAGAYPFLFDVISYVCTHAKSAIQDVGNYFSVTMPYEKFLEFALGYFTNQTQYLQNEIYKLTSKAQTKLIAIDEKTSILAQPVIIAIKKGEREVSAKGKRGSKQLGIETDMTIQILFLKALFYDTYNDTRYLNYPKAWYASIVEAINRMKHTEFIFNNDIDIPAMPKITSKVNEEYPPEITPNLMYKYIQYIKLHDNQVSEIQRIDQIDLIKHVLPEYIRTQNGKDYIKRKGTDEKGTDINMVLKWMSMSLLEISSISGADRLPKEIRETGTHSLKIFYTKRENRQNKK
jgi:hypothetical protein